MASGATLKPEQRNATFQPGGSARLATAVVLKPAQSARPVALWSGVKIQKITPAVQAPARVEIAGQPVAKPADAVAVTGAAKPAGGAR